MKRVWVTRDEEPRGELSSALAAAGLEPVLEPVLTRRVLGDVAAALKTLGERDWLVLTSPFAVSAIPADLVRCRVAVVAESSRRAADARGLRVERESPDGTGDALWRSLRHTPDGARRILFPRSDRAKPRDGWPGVEVLSPVLYETLTRAFDLSVAKRVDAAALTSPSAAEAIAGTPSVPPCASIGPTTSAAMRRVGIAIWLESPRPDFGIFAGAIASTLKSASR